MAAKALPCPTVLRLLLRYEPETGKLFWRRRAPIWFKDGGANGRDKSCAIWNGRYADNPVTLQDNGHGYKHFTLTGRPAYAHRVIFAIVHGRWPDEVDHINGVRDDNRACNLREASRHENARNVRSRGRTSKYLGVSWHSAKGAWRAVVTVNGRAIHAGYFPSEETAARAYDRAARASYGEFARPNFT